MAQEHTTSKTAVAIALCIATAFLFGCEPKVASPRNPEKRVAASQAMLEAEQLAQEKEREAKAIESKFQIAVKKVEAQAQINLAEITAAHNESLDKVQAEATALRETTKQAIAVAEEQQNAWLNGINAIGGVAQQSGLPGIATIGGLLTGVVGMVSAGRNKILASNAEAEKKKQAEIAARLVDSIDVLKHIAPEVAGAMKANSRILSEWQGPEVVNFVNKVQHT